MRIFTSVAVLLVCALLGGCSRGLVLRVQGSPQAPTFVLLPAGGGEFSAMGPGYLIVRERSEQASEAAWSLRVDDLNAVGRSVSIHYGQSPPGAVELVPARPLKPNAVYEVTASGGGYYGGGALFTNRHGRLVTVSGTGDEPFREIRAAP